MSNEILIGFYKKYIAALNSRDFESFQMYLHDIIHLNGKPITQQELVQFLRDGVVQVVPDSFWEVDEIIVDQCRLAVRLVYSGTPIDEFMDNAFSGSSFSVIEYAIYEVEDGRIKIISAVIDAAAMREQLADCSTS